jgi:hypothetical protein
MPRRPGACACTLSQIDPLNMSTLITVLKSGGRYNAVWVERLARGVRRHAPAFERILCLTDLPLAVAGVERVPLRHDWPAWWAKMEAFRPGLTEGTTLLCDLDTVFTGPAGALAEPGLAAMEDYFHKGRLSSALLRWPGDELAGLYERFAGEPERWMTAGSSTLCTVIRSSSTICCARQACARASSKTSHRTCSTSTIPDAPLTALS